MFEDAPKNAQYHLRVLCKWYRLNWTCLVIGLIMSPWTVLPSECTMLITQRVTRLDALINSPFFDNPYRWSFWPFWDTIHGQLFELCRNWTYPLDLQSICLPHTNNSYWQCESHSLLDFSFLRTCLALRLPSRAKFRNCPSSVDELDGNGVGYQLPKGFFLS